jgi:hypothetical protein
MSLGSTYVRPVLFLSFSRFFFIGNSTLTTLHRWQLWVTVTLLVRSAGGPSADLRGLTY